MKALEDLKEILEDELKKITKKGDITPTELENAYKAVDILKDITTIKAMEESGQGEEQYSQRYYPRNSYAPVYGQRGSYDGGSYNASYDGMSNDGYSGNWSRDGQSYDGRAGRDGDSDGRYSETGSYARNRDSMGRYSRADSKEQMRKKLHQMLNEASDEQERKAIMKCIEEL